MAPKKEKFWWETISEEEGRELAKARAAGDRENAKKMLKSEKANSKSKAKKKPAAKKK